MVPVAKFVTKEVDGHAFKKIKAERYWIMSKKTILGHKIKAEDKFLQQMMGSARSLSARTELSHDKKTKPKA